MGNISFPQLSSGAIAQYSLSKQRSSRTVRNVMRDGRLISYPDFGAARLNWNLTYNGLSSIDAETLKACFDACAGPFQPLTFIDPTSNALTWSSDLSNDVWRRLPLMTVTGNAGDPVGGSSAFTIVNAGQTEGTFTQTISVPSNYHYCLSFYVKSAETTSLVLLRQGSHAEDDYQVSVGPSWARVQSSGRLNDGGNLLTVGLRLAPGQALSVYGPQLDAQLQSSPYRATGSLGGVFTNCFWATQEIAITADGPDSFSTHVELETTV